MFVAVKFYREKTGGYSGMAYSYETDLPLKAGDRVIVPAGSGKNRAIVVRENVPQSEINPAFFPLKKITEYDVEEAEG